MNACFTLSPRLATRLAVLLPALLLTNGAWADIYAFKDADGTLHFSNVPQDKRYALLMRTPKEAPADSSAPAGERSARPAPAIDPQLRARVAGLIDDTARALNMDAALLHAVIAVESGYNPSAVSPKGAIGLMQLMPATARRYGVADPYDPAQNIRGGAQYLRDLMSRFDNDLKLTLAAYNAGEQAVARYGNTIPPYKETLNYVPRVMSGLARNQQQP
ncbi:lytic transglycosylase domain-containing protein [Pseudogulbenkiania ferrooxidans]|uniref:Lytic transglycosylase catalytic n=1 Tax=Pseudogulbenkiania ferrooxidans 2002 TaxID=279714 RepID=B9Z6B4_9NEIS|nr:lytic transglycosylase domain-containing protein [Pseudogulbenkiania ferrooxidans]EEG07758.1 Lytic transglycosylase catalytic [Pseudogulbenkiania ferrooxidans 2002]